MSNAVSTRSRQLGCLCVGLFVASSPFPVIAGVLNLADPPLILGIADIVVATMLVGVAMVVDVRTRSVVEERHRAAAYDLTRQAATGALLLLVLFLLGRPRIDWNVLLPGLAWRSWLWVYALPALVAALSAAPVAQVQID
jgi:cytochrome bd-type quinol oxidase subunit 2